MPNSNTRKVQREVSATLVDSIVIVVSPLNSLMNDQILKLRMGGIRGSVLNIKVLRIEHADGQYWNETEDVDNIDVDIDFGQCEEKRLQDGYYHIVFSPSRSINFVKLRTASIVEQDIPRECCCNCC